MRPLTCLLATGGVCLLVAPAWGGSVVINEIRIDQPSTDNDEYFELSGDAGTSLTGLTYIVIGDGAGGSGVIENVVDLAGQMIDGSGFFVAAEGTFTLGVADLTVSLNFENSDNVTHMLVVDFTGASGDDLDIDDDGTLDVTPWASVVSAVSLVEDDPGRPPVGDWWYADDFGGDIVGPDGNFVPGHVFRCVAAGTWQIGRFSTTDGVDSPGAANLDCPVPCGVGSGDCFSANGTAGCEDSSCCDLVCGMDPFCCDVTWDQICADLANVTCPGGAPCGLEGAGGCFIANGNLGCDDAGCCDLVCGIDPDCCLVVWDQICADLAEVNCFAGPGDWVINELLADPPPGLDGDANGDGVRDSFDDEFVEIYNNTGMDQNISGWTLSNSREGVRHTFPAGTVVEADCTVVVFGGGFAAGGFGGAVAQIASEGGLGLDNDGETVSLEDAGAVVQTSYTYGNEANNNASITRDPDVTGPVLVQHDTIPEALGALFSPGTRLDGTAFAGCTPPPPDADDDGIPDKEDNCPNTFNPDQADCDDDGLGDVCDDDPDDNGNGIPDICEVEPPVNLLISEIRINHDGADTNEFFELRGDAGTSLDGLTYLVIGDGTGSGTIEAVIDLTGQSVQADGLFVCAEDTITLISLADVDLVVAGGSPGGLNFENSDNVTHLVVANFSGQNGEDLDIDDDGTLDVIPWTHVVDVVSVVEDDPKAGPPNGDWWYADDLGGDLVGPEFVGKFLFAPGHVFRCTPDDTWEIGQFELDFDNDGFFDSDDTPDDTNPLCGGAGKCLGDVNGDTTVNVTDLLLVLTNWGDCPGCPADLNGDDVVNVIDLLLVLTNFGECP